MTRQNHLRSTTAPYRPLSGPGHWKRPRALANWPGALRLVGLGAVICLLTTLGVVLTPMPSVAAAPTCASAGLTLTSAQGTNPVFYIDPGSTPALNSAYSGWRISNAGTTTRANLWIRLGGFTSTGALTLGVNTNEPNAYALGDLAAGVNQVSYTYLTASGATTAVQNYQVQVWTGDPRLTSSTQLCATASSYLRVDTTIQAAANKVSGTFVGPNPPGLGGIVQLTVYGQGTGTIGSGPGDGTDPAVFWLTPAAVSGWQPNAYKLTKSRLYIDPDANGPLPETVYTDQLRLNTLTGGDRPYRIIYTFVAIGVTAGAATTYPVQNIASGTQVKHTTLAGYSAFPTIQPATNVTTVTKSTPLASRLPGQIPFSVTVRAGDFGTTSADLNGDGDTSDAGEVTTNSGLLDNIRDVLPSGTTFVSGSATWRGAAIPDPSNSAGTLAFAGPFVLASNTNPVLTYRLNVPGTGPTPTPPTPTSAPPGSTPRCWPPTTHRQPRPCRSAPPRQP